ncbi:Calx-beta domain-containing protein [Isosphaeraceae bacterium EP7]
MEGRQLLATVPYITINSPKITEATGTNNVVPFTVNLTSASTSPVTMNYQTVNKTALAGSDYIATSGTLTFAPGERVKTIPVTVIGDSAVELSEVFGIQLSGAQNGVLIGSVGIATILDNDAWVAPKLNTGDVQMMRGFTGSKTMVFNVSLNTTVKTSVTVDVATSNVTALAGKDYAALSQRLTFLPGETIKQVFITIYGTETVSADKIFYLKLSGANVELARTAAAGVLKYGA